MAIVRFFFVERVFAGVFSLSIFPALQLKRRG